MPYIEYVGPPGSGKTTAAKLRLVTEGGGCGRKSLAVDTQRICVNILGFPPGYMLTVKLIMGAPRDLCLALRFALDLRANWHIRFWRGLIMAYLLAKSRLLTGGKIIWVVDQGLHQHILSCRANGWLGMKEAISWRERCTDKRYAPSLLIKVVIPLNDTCSRLKQSTKHLKQIGSSRVLDYAKEYLMAFEELYSEVP